MARDNSYRDNTPDSLDLAKTARPVAGSSRKGGNPVLFLVGDSTTRTGTRGNGDNGQWGWGYYAHEWFDEDRITVENHALGGLSCRTFYRDWWPDVIKGVQKGDWVIIQIGHNDSGPYDQPGGRSSIPGTGKETVQVTLRDGRVETVLSYGEYLRRYIDEVRAKGATPLLSTLTPRNQWDNGRVRRKNDSYNIWIREVAAEKNVPVIDLEEISASDFERWSHFKVDYMFYNDNIHSSAYGAAHNAWCMALGIARTDSKLKDYLLPLEQPQQEFVREPGKPALIVTGDSTIQNTDSDPDGMWGWGSVLETVFDPSRITLVNAGKAGRSARTFLNEGRWDKVYNSLQPGDFVVIQFGHNDMGRVGQPPYRAELAGDADESDVVFMANTRQYEVVRSYGWYLRKFIDDVREKGATPILVSLTPRNEWPHGKMERRDDTYGIWVRDVVKQTGVDFVDMHNITADYFDSIGPEATRPYYKNDHTHTSRLGAERNARSFAEGLRKIGHPLAKYLK
ncbi:MAG: rhamnogalacturonan acetylesterase [Bacteroidales bacterium]|nr:rhamnogalacturonan acetylesterase [Bacteroidales bacterium]